MEKAKLPISFWIIGVLLLLWNLIGVMMFFFQMTADPATAFAEFSEDQRQLQIDLISNYPIWAKAGFAIAVFAGLIGSILLLLKNKLARPVFILSLIGMAIQVIYTAPFIMRDLGISGPMGLIFPLMIWGIAIFAIWYSGRMAARYFN